MGADDVTAKDDRTQGDRAGRPSADAGARSERRLLSAYAMLGTGPLELISAACGRLIDKTRRAPEPIRRILWGQRR